jgi:predicted enzyme related to lactoylglutathione lyase
VAEPSASAHGQIEYLQLPALEIERSAAFYQAVFDWSVDPGSGSFEAPGLIGQLTTDIAPAPNTGPLLWISAVSLYRTLQKVESSGGTAPDDDRRTRRRSIQRLVPAAPRLP